MAAITNCNINKTIWFNKPMQPVGGIYTVYFWNILLQKLIYCMAYSSLATRTNLTTSNNVPGFIIQAPKDDVSQYIRGQYMYYYKLRCTYISIQCVSNILYIVACCLFIITLISLVYVYTASLSDSWHIRKNVTWLSEVKM